MKESLFKYESYGSFSLLLFHGFCCIARFIAGARSRREVSRRTMSCRTLAAFLLWGLVVLIAVLEEGTCSAREPAPRQAADSPPSGNAVRAVRRGTARPRPHPRSAAAFTNSTATAPPALAAINSSGAPAAAQITAAPACGTLLSLLGVLRPTPLVQMTNTSSPAMLEATMLYEGAVPAEPSLSPDVITQAASLILQLATSSASMSLDGALCILDAIDAVIFGAYDGGWFGNNSASPDDLLPQMASAAGSIAANLLGSLLPTAAHSGLNASGQLAAPTIVITTSIIQMLLTVPPPAAAANLSCMGFSFDPLPATALP